MAGQVKVAVVSGAISSSGTGTANFTKADFGTPKACIVLLSFDTADDVNVAAEGKASIGFSDFTNHRCITHQDEDGSAKVDSDCRKSNTKTYVILDVGGVVDIDGVASTIADGVQLTNTTNISASAVFATVVTPQPPAAGQSRPVWQSDGQGPRDDGSEADGQGSIGRKL